MKNEKKKGGRGTARIIYAVIILSVLSQLFEDMSYGGISEEGIIAIAVIVVVLVLIITKSAKRMKSPAKERSKELVKQAINTATDPEKAITCTSHSGKERYIAQLDEFLKNGIIEKEEYTITRRKYENLNIEDDYH